MTTLSINASNFPNITSPAIATKLWSTTTSSPVVNITDAITNADSPAFPENVTDVVNTTLATMVTMATNATTTVTTMMTTTTTTATTKLSTTVTTALSASTSSVGTTPSPTGSHQICWEDDIGRVSRVELRVVSIWNLNSTRSALNYVISFLSIDFS